MMHEEIVKYPKKRFVILNMLNLFNEYNRPPERVWVCRGVTESVNEGPVGEESHIQQLEVSLQCGSSRLANTTEKLTGQMEFKVR